MDKKGDISMNMIIMAIIALLVLAIVAFLIFRAGGDVEEAKSCQNLGGQCQASCGGDFPVRSLVGVCAEDAPGDVCCVALGSSSN
jgi:hypothetical protein